MFDDLNNFINVYDIICLCETFCLSSDYEDPLYDTSTITGYTLIHKPRNKCRRASGGLCIAIKNEFLPYVTYVENECNLLLWVKIDKRCFNTVDHVYLACAYVPPETSNYVTSSCFEDIENEIIAFNRLSDYIIVGGDMNAHTGTRADILPHEPEDTHTDNIQTGEPMVYSIESKLEALELPFTRLTEDAHNLNNFGNKLIECCHDAGVCIVNGRYGPESSKCTTTHDTTIDYFLCTPDTFNIITDMSVDIFNPCLSDVHMPIDITLKCQMYEMYEDNCDSCTDDNQTDHGESAIDTSSFKIGKWDNESETIFCENLNMAELLEIGNLLDSVNPLSNVQNDVARITDKIGSLFVDTGIKTFGKRPLNIKRKRIKKKTDKPWYNTICRNSQVVFNQARKKYKLSRDPEDLGLVRKLGRLYKRTIVQANMTYADKVRKEVRMLRRLRSNKQYWKYCKTRNQNDSTKNLNFEKFTSFFEELNKNENKEDFPIENRNVRNEEIDREISESEIVAAIGRLKNGKASGIDHIQNEWIKSTKSKMLNVYKKYFNLIYSTATIPSSWTIGIIKPIYKGKGDKNDPDNYRPITILSCIGKLFTSILNNRINKYLEQKSLLGREQLGFRENHSTTDGVFILHVLSKLMKHTNRQLYCAFIDLKKCFGSIWREALWAKISELNIGSKMTNVIKSMYQNLKSCVMMYINDHDDNAIVHTSRLFDCEKGLREGEHLSPILFSMYVNDLNNYLISKQCNDVSVAYRDDKYVLCYVILPILMYADDSVLFALNKRGLQKSLNAYEQYCNKWKLDINVNKTKILCFGRKNQHVFTINNEAIENVDVFKYLGVVLSRNGRFEKAMLENVNKARKGMYTLRKTFREKMIPIDCQIDLFEKTIEPILLYGCEIWGAGKIEIIEKFRCKIIKQILGLRASTPAYMVYGEIGKLPLRTIIDKRIISFWGRIVNGNTNKLSFAMYRLMLQNYGLGVLKETTWTDYIKQTLINAGYHYIWQNQRCTQLDIQNIKQRLHDLGVQSMYTIANIETSNKGKNYTLLKPSWQEEKYLSILTHRKTVSLIKFRTGNHRLPVETGRYNNIPYAERRCQNCPNSIGDEYHFLFECNLFTAQRKRYIDRKYYVRPSMSKYLLLMQSTSTYELNNLAKMTEIIMNTLK